MTDETLKDVYMCFIEFQHMVKLELHQYQENSIQSVQTVSNSTQNNNNIAAKQSVDEDVKMADASSLKR